MKYALLLIAFLALGCAAESKKEEVQPPTTTQSGISNMPDATQAGRMDFMTSPNLTPEQKDKFMKLMSQTEVKMAGIKQDQANLKAALFRSLSEGKYNKKDVNSYKSKIKKLESKKMDLMFSNLDRAHEILGKDFENNPDFVRAYLNRANF